MISQTTEPPRPTAARADQEMTGVATLLASNVAVVSQEASSSAIRWIPENPGEVRYITAILHPVAEQAMTQKHAPDNHCVTLDLGAPPLEENSEEPVGA